MAELGQRHPGVTVSTTSALSAAEVVAMVAEGRCEVGVCGSAERPAGRGLVAHHLRDEEMLLVVAARAPAAPNRPPKASSMAASASARSGAITTPFPAASPSALITKGGTNRSSAAFASAAVSQTA